MWTELLGGNYVEVLQAIRQPRGKLLDRAELLRAIDLAALKLQEKASADPSMILVLFDADEDAPCILGPQIQAVARHNRSHLDVAVVLANVEFETWFAAAAESLTKYFDLSMSLRRKIRSVPSNEKGRSLAG